MEIRLRVGLPLNSGWRQIREISNECGGPLRAVRKERHESRLHREPIPMISGAGSRQQNSRIVVVNVICCGETFAICSFRCCLLSCRLCAVTRV